MARAAWDEHMSCWVSNFELLPDHLRDQRERIAGLIGRRLITGWTGWTLDRGQWYPIIPLVSEFEDGIQLELSWNHRSEISITWNTVDLAVPPRFASTTCEWRSAQPDPLGDIAGHTVTGFAIVETPYFRGEDLDFDNDELPMHAVAGWDASGLWIAFGENGLLVYDGGEDNRLSAEQAPPPHEEVARVTPWP